ncbi:hypothetical protein U0070_027521 [Myodes glareolus]|uniref:Uncharacterized protein n=1 Tax=Myodes glareolus TaxID=447135 RepID=A0AAW0HJU4_MYOGA
MTWVPSRYFPKGRTSQESALQIVVGCEHTRAAGPSPSCTVASIEGLGSDSMDPAGAVDGSHHGSHHIKRMAQF